MIFNKPKTMKNIIKILYVLYYKYFNFLTKIRIRFLQMKSLKSKYWKKYIIILTNTLIIQKNLQQNYMHKFLIFIIKKPRLIQAKLC